MKAAALSCAATLAIASPSAEVLSKFQAFRAKWGHRYVGTEFTRRLGYFETHLANIEALQQAEQGTAVYSHLGPFADSSPDEMAQRLGWFEPQGWQENAPTVRLNNTAPSSFDWVADGCVNPVQNQARCGSCWAFSTAANLEGAGCVSNNKKLVKVSEQNIMDCDKTCYSCNGGLPSLALTWSSQNGGVASEADYPYRGRDESCKNIGKIIHNKGYTKVGQSDDELKQALVKYGPLSIGVDATPFQHYSGGIMQNPSCSKTRLDHAVNIVGYGSSNSLFYWKIRNSWATSWGEQGYIRLAGDCTCGLCTTVVSATGVTISDSPTPTPPGPVPPPSCSDTINWCPSTPNWECQFLAAECQKSCGCCGANPPSYCAASTKTMIPHSIFDEIKKLVCQYIANGVAEAEAEKLICAQFGNEVAICDEIVKILWSELEKTCASSAVVSPSMMIPHSIFDEIKKLVCQYIANGVAEAEAEKLICSQFSSEVAICDEVVKILWSELEKTCASSAVVSAKVMIPQSIFDEIKKLVCQYIANGVVEAEAEKLICSQFSSEVAICDEVVKILWSELEQTCASSVVV